MTRRSATYALKLVFYLMLVLFVVSCGKRDYRLERALEFAGDNRKELQQVLDHYANDDLKYKAAHFLITNMPYHWTYQNSLLTKYRKELKVIVDSLKCNGDQAIRILTNKYGPLDPEKFIKVYDSKVITAEFLIRNIDLAFKAWKAHQWEDDEPHKMWADRGEEMFEHFCEEILPYRIENEPLEDWRTLYYERFKMVEDSIKLLHITNPVDACRILYNEINKEPWNLFASNPIPQMGASTLLDNRIGTCEDKSDFATYAMRALGISGGRDFVLQYPNRMLGHSWSYVRRNVDETVEFELNDHPPGEPAEFQWKKGCVYRKTFAPQKNSIAMRYPDTYIPESLKNAFMEDVTYCYIRGSHPMIDIAGSGSRAQIPVVFLATFNNQHWYPIYWSERDHESAFIPHVERDVVLLPVMFEDGKQVPVGPPFFYDITLVTRFLTPDKNAKERLVLHRKYPVQPWWQWIIKRPIGGKFQLSNDPLFRNAVTVFTIKDQPEMAWHNITVNRKEKFRYIRYLSADTGYCNMAEVVVKGNNQVISGKVIGTEGSIGNDPKRERGAVYDGDPLTFFDAPLTNGAWAGLDLGTPARIDEISFLFRNDDNNIRIGDTYELVYWDDKWISLGTKVATSSDLVFDNCPKNALFLLHNRTRGSEERIFTYDKGEQVWF